MGKKSFFVVLIISYCLNVQAQSTIGLTGKRDTSYSTYTAYESTKKTHPEIKIVHEFHSDSVKETKKLFELIVKKCV